MRHWTAPICQITVHHLKYMLLLCMSIVGFISLVGCDTAENKPHPDLQIKLAFAQPPGGSIQGKWHVYRPDRHTRIKMFLASTPILTAQDIRVVLPGFDGTDLPAVNIDFTQQGLHKLQSAYDAKPNQQIAIVRGKKVLTYMPLNFRPKNTGMMITVRSSVQDSIELAKLMTQQSDATKQRK